VVQIIENDFLAPIPNRGLGRAESIPADCRAAFKRLYGQRHEAKFRLPGALAPDIARTRFAVWLAEVEGRITRIRAGPNDDALSLSERQARALAGAAAGQTKPAVSLAKLFEQWLAERQPARSTVERWRGVFVAAEARFPNASKIDDDVGCVAELLKMEVGWALGLLRGPGGGNRALGFSAW
jgi:hypothetical protein